MTGTYNLMRGGTVVCGAGGGEVRVGKIRFKLAKPLVGQGRANCAGRDGNSWSGTQGRKVSGKR